MSNTATPSGERQNGIVKWFNDNVGYGFITVNSGEHKTKDIFVHFSAIHLLNSQNKHQYRYLVQGEYVDFDLVSSQNEQHEYQAVNVTGVNGGPLMYETRMANLNHESKPRASVSNAASASQAQSPSASQAQAPATAASHESDSLPLERPKLIRQTNAPSSGPPKRGRPKRT